MTPLGHLATGYLLHRALPFGRVPAGRALLSAIVGTLAPDCDFLLFPLLPGGLFNTLHRTASHSLIFVLLLTAVTGRWLDWRRVAACALLHLCIDTVFDANASNGLGVAWGWPLYNEPVNFGFSACLRSEPSWDDPFAEGHFQARLVNFVVLELPLVVTATLLSIRARRFDSSPRTL